MDKTTILNEKHFFEALLLRSDEFRDNLPLKISQKSTSEYRVKSVLSSTAQTAEPCKLVTLDPVVKCAMQLIDHVDKTLPVSISAICELQFLNGLRISEVLRIKSQDIMTNGSIRIHGSKGSENRVVFAIKHQEFWQFFRANCNSLPSYLNRYYIYRVYKSKGIYTAISGDKVNSVTHILRYNYIYNMLNDNIPLNEIQQQIGHKALKSTIHYVENIKKRSRL